MVESAPGKGTVEQPRRELTDLRTQPCRLLAEALGSAQGAGLLLVRKVAEVSRTPTAPLARVSLDQLAAVVDTHKLGSPFDLDGGAERAQLGRNRVERTLELDVVVEVDLERRAQRQRIRSAAQR